MPETLARSRRLSSRRRPSRDGFARALAAIVGAVMLVSAVAIATSARVAVADDRVLTATPAAGLGNQVVRVAWQGFRPTVGDLYNVLIYQCTLGALGEGPDSLSDCNTDEPFPAAAEGNRLIGKTAEDGTGSLFFEVRPARYSPRLACSATIDCALLAFENDPADPPPPTGLPSTAVWTRLEFAPSASDCPGFTDFDLRADGSSSGAPLFASWAATLCQGEDGMVLDYTETSSSEGRENFLAGLVDVGVTAVPANAEELEAHPDHEEFAYAPVSLTAVAVVVNMIDQRTRRPIEDLVLSPRLVTRLVTNSDLNSFLTDPELRALNPGVTFPLRFTRPLLRSERDADTRFLTSWMISTDAARDFLALDDPYDKPLNPEYIEYVDQYPVEAFEVVDSSDQQYLPRTGQRNVALRAFYRVAPAGSAPEPNDVGMIGIVDLPTARRFGLPTAKLINRAGNAVGPTDAAITAGYEAMTETEEGTLLPRIDAQSREAYPLVKVDYAMIPTNPTVVNTEGDEQADRDKARFVARVLERVIAARDEPQLPGYLRLPDHLAAQTSLIAAVMRAIADPTTPPTTTTTTTPVPTTTPTTTFGTPTTFATVPFTTPTTFPSGGGVTTAPTGVGDTSSTTAGNTRRTTTTTGTSATTTPEDEPPKPQLSVPAERMGIPAFLALGGLALLSWAGSNSVVARRRARGRRTPDRAA